MTFAEKLRLLLDEKQLSCAELAERCGISKSGVSQYLSGKIVPRDRTKKKIAYVLGVEFGELDEDLDGRAIDNSNVTVSECARLLGKSEQFVRVALQQGIAPFGFAVKNKSEYNYHISRKLLCEYIGGGEENAQCENRA